MSKRRNAGEWVWLPPNCGFVGTSHKLRAEIQREAVCDEMPCFLCDDPACREWGTLWTEPDADGKRYPLYHVCECQMLDAPFSDCAKENP